MQSSSPEQGLSCMDAELQWDAAILTVMVDSHAEANAGERGKLLSSTAFLLPEE